MMTEEEFAALPEDGNEPFASAHQMHGALDAGGVGLWEMCFADERVAFNDAACRVMDLPHGADFVSFAEFEQTIHSEDLAEFQRSLQLAIGSDGEIAIEFRLNGRDPRFTQWVCFSGRVTERDTGRPVRAAGVVHDVTDRRFEQEASDLLNRELAHRMKNLFSVVGSIAAVSAESHPEAKPFVQTFQSRLNSLAAAHDLLKERQWLFMPLEDLAGRVVEPLGVLNRIHIDAGDLMFGDYDMQTLVLVLHELATNALKYGALSNDEGSVALRFESLQEDPNSHEILMTWQEIAGPPVIAPTDRGFGMTLLDRLAKRHGHDAPVVEWHESGLFCRLRFRAGAR
ncbi:Blue-light-activated histidine kinase [Methyloligella halotolerans]|uniref:Blue-light-activated histidine kinase n=1 Tax=Methyloligella halotolerans TaxID=1177755 RepID=A0A1E2RY99_9HYPH|nr:HWE histidine kinase domain-containing protein [Methyloligella halotolerans]ODA67194.1 Blue-light-activated histidine kinase [Methyloligella halotolerans]